TLREWLEQDLFGVDMREPRTPDGVVALGRDAPGDGLALEAWVGKELRNRIGAHCRLLRQPAARARWQRILTPNTEFDRASMSKFRLGSRTRTNNRDRWTAARRQTRSSASGGRECSDSADGYPAKSGPQKSGICAGAGNFAPVG